MKSRYLFLLALVGLQPPASAQLFSLGTAQNFAVLGGSTVTNTGSSVISGDLGLSLGTSITGFPPGTVTPPSTTHNSDTVALQAQQDVATSYNALAGMKATQDLSGQDLGGKTLAPGIYSFTSTAQLTGTLTLDAQGNSNALFVFQIGSTLTTASSAIVSIINGGSAFNVFFQVGSSATLGTSTSFEGNILADQSITLNTSANVVAGRVLAENGAVTLDTNDVTSSTALFVSGPAGTFETAVPEPGFVALLVGMSVTGSGLLIRHRKTIRQAD